MDYMLQVVVLGGITIIETFPFLSENKLKLELTGQQGNVMKESMSVSKTVAWNLLTNEQKKKLEMKNLLVFIFIVQKQRPQKMDHLLEQQLH